MPGVLIFDCRKYWATEQTTTADLVWPAAHIPPLPSTYLPLAALEESDTTWGSYRARGLNLTFVGKAASDVPGRKLQAQAIGWRKCVNPVGGAVIEYRPIYRLVVEAVLGNVPGTANGYGTDLYFAHKITEITPPGFGLTALPGASVVIHSPEGDREACLTIVDASHFYDGWTFSVKVQTSDSAWATQANILVQYVF